MGVLALVCAFLLFARAESYVLLTANVDDLHAIANQLAKSPVYDHLKDIWRRASKTFQSQYSKFRADEDQDSGDAGTEQSVEDNQERGDSEYRRTKRRKAIDNLLQLGRNASVYVKQMFENL